MLSCTAQTMVPPVSTGSAAGRGAYQVTTSPSMTSSPSGCPKRQAPGRMHRWLRQGRQLRMGDLLPSTFGSVAHSHTQATLLVKSQRCNVHCYQGAFHRGKVPIFLSFKDGMSKLFPTNL